MLISNTHREKSDSFIESVQILSCPQLGKFIKKSYIWDPTTKQATRPLAMFNSNSKILRDARLSDANFRDVRFDVMLDNSQNIHYYTHDANKNVTELISDSGAISAHYEYSPFGAVTTTAEDLVSQNNFTFSSEYIDSELGLNYYNYRHYNSLDGRWISRDPIEEAGGFNLYVVVDNNIINDIDIYGLLTSIDAAFKACMAMLSPVLRLKCLKDLLLITGATKVKDAIKQTEKLVNKATQCAAIHAQYKISEKLGANCGQCLSPTEYLIKILAITAELAGRLAYLNLKCDYVLEGSIKKGIPAAINGHNQEYAEKSAYLSKCIAYSIKAVCKNTP